jgi:hypothetical protein
MNLNRFLAPVLVLAFVSLATFATSPAQSAPVAPASIAAQAAATAPIEKARLFCFNRFTGQFLHWGACGGYHRYYRPYRRHYYYYRPRPRYYYHPRRYYHRPRWHLNYY